MKSVMSVASKCIKARDGKNVDYLNKNFGIIMLLGMLDLALRGHNEKQDQTTEIIFMKFANFCLDMMVL